MYIWVEPVKTGDSVDHFRLSAASRALIYFWIRDPGAGAPGFMLTPAIAG